MLTEHKEQLAKVKKMLVDGGYGGEVFANQVKKVLQGAEVKVAKRSELHQFKVIPKRWIVERSFGWLEKCRRLWKNCERRLSTSLQMVVLAFLRVCLQRL
jgi:transposase